jgi:mono/diheme cytochrome c family protein
MSWIRWSALSLTGLCIVTVVTAVSCARTQTPGAPTRAEMVERGRYLTMTSGCQDCHTPGTFFGRPDFKRQLSGSELGWKGPWGVTYASNLTPDDETGIGAWSEAEIVTAIRAGSAPDGRAILPPMPWPMYASFSDADASAIAAYLKSIPAVSHRVPDRLGPGMQPAGGHLDFPPPPTWDVPPAPPETKSAP